MKQGTKFWLLLETGPLGEAAAYYQTAGGAWTHRICVIFVPIREHMLASSCAAERLKLPPMGEAEIMNSRRSPGVEGGVAALCHGISQGDNGLVLVDQDLGTLTSPSPCNLRFTTGRNNRWSSYTPGSAEPNNSLQVRRMSNGHTFLCAYVMNLIMSRHFITKNNFIVKITIFAYYFSGWLRHILERCKTRLRRESRLKDLPNRSLVQQYWSVKLERLSKCKCYLLDMEVVIMEHLTLMLNHFFHPVNQLCNSGVVPLSRRLFEPLVDPPGGHLSVAEGLRHRQLVEVYGEKCMDIKNVRKWCREFNEGRINVHDEQQSGRPSLPESTVAQIDEMVRANRRITLEEIEDGLNEDCSHFSVHKIVSETLGYRKVSARWVDKWLKEAAGEWYNTGITKLVDRMKKVIEHQGDYYGLYKLLGSVWLLELRSSLFNWEEGGCGRIKETTKLRAMRSVHIHMALFPRFFITPAISSRVSSAVHSEVCLSYGTTFKFFALINTVDPRFTSTLEYELFTVRAKFFEKFYLGLRVKFRITSNS
ncbi:hypothetical protein LAZ67_18001567 [Cordylochernes scorpioides]|uniref:Mos1 transposase HTH domain-containing protein n=1 Tax=Cordylochernes scorpioides TaxID=51811 RepID=A0ABY6LI04_9ARAC|nr:hypothetical protein LAZ67_18001567 [Cordylochernes scorpioides]